MDFGKQLIALRKDREPSVGRRKLADESGLSLSYLHEVENDVYLPSHERLGLIADALGVRGDEREQLFKERDKAEMERLGFKEADVTLLLKETGPLTEEARDKIFEILEEVRGSKPGPAPRVKRKTPARSPARPTK